MVTLKSCDCLLYLGFKINLFVFICGDSLDEQNEREWSQSLFSATMQTQGTRVMVTLGLAYKMMSSLQHSINIIAVILKWLRIEKFHWHGLLKLLS